MSEHRHPERIGLYIMVIIILLFGPCRMRDDHNAIIDKLDKIVSQQIGVK